MKIDLDTAASVVAFLLILAAVMFKSTWLMMIGCIAVVATVVIWLSNRIHG